MPWGCAPIDSHSVAVHSTTVGPGFLRWNPEVPDWTGTFKAGSHGAQRLSGGSGSCCGGERVATAEIKV